LIWKLCLKTIKSEEKKNKFVSKPTIKPINEITPSSESPV